VKILLFNILLLHILKPECTDIDNEFSAVSSWSSTFGCCHVWSVAQMDTERHTTSCLYSPKISKIHYYSRSGEFYFSVMLITDLCITSIICRLVNEALHRWPSNCCEAKAQNGVVEAGLSIWAESIGRALHFTLHLPGRAHSVVCINAEAKPIWPQGCWPELAMRCCHHQWWHNMHGNVWIFLCKLLCHLVFRIKFYVWLIIEHAIKCYLDWKQ